MTNKKELVGTILLFTTAVIWGLAFTAQRNGMDFMGAFTFNGTRFLLGACSLVPVILLFERTKGRAGGNAPPNEDAAFTRPSKAFTYKVAVLGGLVLFIAAGLQQIGIEITMSAGKAGFITGLYIVLTPILSRVLGKKIAPRVWAGAVFACAGLYLLSVRPGEAGGGSLGLGDAALIAGAFFWALHIIVIDRWADKILPLRFAATQFAVCGVLSMACAFVLENVEVSSLIAGYAPVLYSAFLSVGVAYTLQIIGQKYVEPSKAALIFSAESLFGAIGAALLLGEIMSAQSYIGCALIFLGIVVSQLGKRMV